ncbi:MAG: hypothetical protein QOG23_3153 [Blastocatellia bacterium]|jgi:hypothetical protein|nr:hypothetical protein [Blastocatellia bacterium]
MWPICEIELTACDYERTVADGKECKVLENSWWLQLLKRQIPTFLPQLRFGTREVGGRSSCWGKSVAG